MYQMLVSAVKFYCIFLCLFSAAEFTFYKWLADPNDYIHYHATEGVRVVGTPRGGGPLQFVSKSYVKGGFRYLYTDTLYCREHMHEKLGLFSSQPFPKEQKYTETFDTERDPWFYTRPVPPAGWQCETRSTPRVFFGYGIHKDASKVIGERFTLR